MTPATSSATTRRTSTRRTTTAEPRPQPRPPALHALHADAPPAGCRALLPTRLGFSTCQIALPQHGTAKRASVRPAQNWRPLGSCFGCRWRHAPELRQPLITLRNFDSPSSGPVAGRRARAGGFPLLSTYASPQSSSHAVASRLSRSQLKGSGGGGGGVREQVVHLLRRRAKPIVGVLRLSGCSCSRHGACPSRLKSRMGVSAAGLGSRRGSGAATVAWRRTTPGR
jgi:hypothetical protein